MVCNLKKEEKEKEIVTHHMKKMKNSLVDS